MTPVKSRFVAHRIIEGEGFVVDTRIQLLHHLNPVGAVIWKNIDGKRTDEEISRAVADAYDISPEEALKDVQEFLIELKEKNLIEERAHERIS